MLAVHHSRHQFVWLDPDRAALIASVPDTLQTAKTWVAMGRPLITRRRASNEPGSGLVLGLALPELLGRGRLVLNARREAVERLDPPPLLSEISTVLPATWLPNCRELGGRLSRCGVVVRVYGSAAWEWLTGERYLRATSDLDLLLEPGADWDTAQALTVMADVATSCAPRFDGEVALGGGEFVAWRELLLTSTDVLVKTGRSVELRRRKDVEFQLERAATA